VTSEADRLLTTIEAAQRLGISARTLEKWRYEHNGPTVTRMGRVVRYDPKDLETYKEEHKQP
jgi:excisionase family DNA binding protein